MGIMQNKVTRRFALGSVAGGLAGTAAIIHALKGHYGVNVPTDNIGHSRRGGTATLRVYGRTIGPIDLPTMEVKNSEDLKKYDEMVAQIVRERTYKTLAGYSEDDRKALVAELVEKKVGEWEAEIERIESHSFFEVCSEGLDEKQKEELLAECAKMSEVEKARGKQTFRSNMSDSLTKWKDGEGQRAFEQHIYQELFSPPKPLTNEQQLQVDKQVAKQRLADLKSGTFEKSMRRSLEESFRQMVQSGHFPEGRVKQAVEQGTEAAITKEREWVAAQASNAL